MPSVRSTTAPPPVRDAAASAAAASRDAVRAVAGSDAVDADRRRSVREELNAAEEHRPLALPDGAEADVHDVVEAIGKLGPEALRVLQPTEQVRRLAETGVDEQV